MFSCSSGVEQSLHPSKWFHLNWSLTATENHCDITEKKTKKKTPNKKNQKAPTECYLTKAKYAELYNL